MHQCDSRLTHSQGLTVQHGQDVLLVFSVHVHGQPNQLPYECPYVDFMPWLVHRAAGGCARACQKGGGKRGGRLAASALPATITGSIGMVWNSS